MTEFNLSEKIIPIGKAFAEKPTYLDAEDVKEFIKQIIDLLEKHPSQIRTDAVIGLLKRKAGDKLI